MGPARLRGRDARRPPVGTRRTDHTASPMPAGAGSEPTEQITHSGAPQKSSNETCIPTQNGGYRVPPTRRAVTVGNEGSGALSDHVVKLRTEYRSLRMATAMGTRVARPVARGTG